MFQFKHISHIFSFNFYIFQRSWIFARLAAGKLLTRGYKSAWEGKICVLHKRIEHRNIRFIASHASIYAKAMTQLREIQERE